MAHFITHKCIGCGLCAGNCPTTAISGEPKQPHHIDPSVCIDCGACGRVCVVGAITDEKGNECSKVAPEDRPAPCVDTGKCSGCKLCIENCVSGALTTSAPLFKGDIRIHSVLAFPKKCTGCGMCERVCPIGAIKMAGRDKL